MQSARIAAWTFLLAVAGARLAAQAVEVEHNGGRDYATPIGTATTIQGTFATVDDLDVWVFQSNGEYFRFQATPTRSFAITILADDGKVVFDSGGIAGSSTPRAATYLPAGTFYLELRTAVAGPYSISLLRDPCPVSPLLPGANAVQATPVGVTQDVRSFVLTGAERVQIAVVPSTVAFQVHRADGLLLRGNTGAIDMDLPAGEYRVRAFPTTATTTVTGTVTLTTTPIVMPDLLTAGAQTAVSLGQASRRLYRVVLGSPATLDLWTTPLPGNDPDSVLHLLDRNLQAIALADDTDAVAATYGTAARLSVPLPAGEYYVQARMWYTLAGSFTVHASTSPLPPVPVVTPGSLVLNVPGNGGVDAVAFDVCSGHDVEIGVNAPTFSFWTVIDSQGFCAGPSGWDTEAGIAGPAPRGARASTTCRLLPGRYWLFGCNRYWQPVQQNFDVRAPLRCAAGNLTTIGREGDLCGLLLDFQTAPGLDLGAIGLSGRLCLPFPSPTLLTVGFGVYPANGALTWMACPPVPHGIPVQHVDLFATPVGRLGAIREPASW